MIKIAILISLFLDPQHIPRLLEAVMSRDFAPSSPIANTFIVKPSPHCKQCKEKGEGMFPLQHQQHVKQHLSSSWICSILSSTVATSACFVVCTQHAPQSLCNLPIVINLKGVFTPNIDTVNILKRPVINFPFPSSPCSHVQTMCKSPIRTRGKRRKSFQRNVVTFLKLFL